MSIFHPRTRVRLVIRTEEYANTKALEQRLPSSQGSRTAYGGQASKPPPRPSRPVSAQETAKLLTRNEQQLRNLALLRDTLSADDYAAKRQVLIKERESIRSGALLSVKLQAGGLRPDAVAGAADDQTVIGSIIPLNASLERAGLNAPNTFSVTLNYSDAPFDPRTIRSCGVEVLIGVVPPQDMYDGIELGKTRGDGSLVSTIGDEPDGSIKRATRIVGFVDDWTVKYSEEGDYITLQGRDMSAPLRDIKLASGDGIDITLPIDQGIQVFLDSVSPTTAGVIVKYEGHGDPPIPAGASKDRRRPRRGKNGKRARRGDQDMTMWDHIMDVCVQNGMVPIIRDFELVVSEPRTLYSSTSSLRMVYGANLESLEFSRRMTGIKVPTIEVRCYDATIGRTRWARWPTRAGELKHGIMGVTNPPLPLRANEIPPSGANPTETIRTKVVTGVTDPIMLERIARNTFEMIGRQEIEGHFSTYEVSSYGKDPFEVDLLDARPSDPIEILVMAATDPTLDGTSSATEIQSFTRERRKQYLASLGWNDKVASRFSALQEDKGFQSVFRLQDIKIDWEWDSGIKISCGVINYITVREDQVIADDPVAQKVSEDTLRGQLQRPLFTTEGPSVYNAAYAHNVMFSKPHPTLWNTQLGQDDEEAFRQWVRANHIPFDVNATYTDYDMRGYWLEVIKPGGVFEGGHFPDTYKTPFDSTFSAESNYATPDCPFKWSGERLIDTRNGQVVFFSGE